MHAQGRTLKWIWQGMPGVEIILRDVQLNLPENGGRPKTGTDDTLSDRPILPAGAPEFPFPLRVQADRIELGAFPSIHRLLVQTIALGRRQQTAPEPLRIATRGSWCEVDFDGEAAADQAGEIAVQVQGSIRDVAFSNLVACGLAVSAHETPPVYLEGRTTGRFLVAIRGRTLADVQDLLSGIFR